MGGFMCRQLAMGGVEQEAWGYFAVCVPIVVFCAPLGSLIGSHLHRLVLAGFVIVTDVVQLVGALVIVQPWSHKKTDSPATLCASSTAILLCALAIFRCMTAGGQRLVQQQQQQQQRNGSDKGTLPPSHVSVPVKGEARAQAQSEEPCSISGAHVMPAPQPN